MAQVLVPGLVWALLSIYLRMSCAARNRFPDLRAREGIYRRRYNKCCSLLKLHLEQPLGLLLEQAGRKAKAERFGRVYPVAVAHYLPEYRSGCLDQDLAAASMILEQVHQREREGQEPIYRYLRV